MKAGGGVGRGLVRQGGRVDAWARVRPRERDGDRGHTEEQGVVERGLEAEKERERRGEEG